MQNYANWHSTQSVIIRKGFHFVHDPTLVVFFLKFSRSLAEAALETYAEIFRIHKAGHKGNF